MNFLPAVLKAVNCVDAVDIFTQLRQGRVFLLGGAAKFQVDVKEGEGGMEGVWPKRPVDVKWGKSEYVDSPL